MVRVPVAAAKPPVQSAPAHLHDLLALVAVHHLDGRESSMKACIKSAHGERNNARLPGRDGLPCQPVLPLPSFL